MTLRGKAATEIEVYFPYGKFGLVLIEASKLNRSDAFMQYKPATREEKNFKALVSRLIFNQAKDFWCFKQYPFSNETEDGICFKYNGTFPEVSCEKWRKMAQLVLPEMESDLATRSQFVAAHAVLLKKLVEAGVPAEDAWRMVCINHIELMEYLNSREAKENEMLDGIRDVNLFYSLLSMSVIMKHKKEDGYWVRENLYDDHVSTYGLLSCNLDEAYWIAGISTAKGRNYSLSDLDLCSVADRPMQKAIGLVVCNLV